MRKVIFVFSLFIFSMVYQSCKTAEKNPFWADGEAFFEVQQIFNDERLPNVVTATDGSLIAVWGWNNVRVRRSEDGGAKMARFNLVWVTGGNNWRKYLEE